MKIDHKLPKIVNTKQSLQHYSDLSSVFTPLISGTVADNVRYGPQLRGKKLTEAEVKNLLSLADLDPALSSKPASELSVGQAQRVALARTLANDPEARAPSDASSSSHCPSLASLRSCLYFHCCRCSCWTSRRAHWTPSPRRTSRRPSCG